MSADLNRFDTVAGYYDFLAYFVFGRAIRYAQSVMLGQIPDNSRVLVLGGGTGWWLNELMTLKPGCHIVYIEASLKMLEAAKKRVDGTGNKVEFIHGTEDYLIDKRDKFDVVVTYFFLDIFSNRKLGRALWLIEGALSRGGIWLVAEFLNKKWWHRSLLNVMYLFFQIAGCVRIRNLPDWETLLSEVPMRRTWRELRFGNFIESSIWQRT